MTGDIGLFFSALLAATLLPLSSEVVLAALAATEGRDLVYLVALATAGNTLGAWINWALGRYCLSWRSRRWFPIKPEKLNKATDWFGRYGVWSLLLAWLPVVGDPLTFAAGILKVNVWKFLVLVATGKGARYVAVVIVVKSATGI